MVISISPSRGLFPLHQPSAHLLLARTYPPLPPQFLSLLASSSLYRLKTSRGCHGVKRGSGACHVRACTKEWYSVPIFTHGRRRLLAILRVCHLPSFCSCSQHPSTKVLPVLAHSFVLAAPNLMETNCWHCLPKAKKRQK